METMDRGGDVAPEVLEWRARLGERLELLTMGLVVAWAAIKLHAWHALGALVVASIPASCLFVDLHLFLPLSWRSKIEPLVSLFVVTVAALGVYDFTPRFAPAIGILSLIVCGAILLRAVTKSKAQ